MTDILDSSLSIQQESVQFNQPVSESAATAIGALANYLRHRILPLGSIVYSMLDESTFQSQTQAGSPATWMLANGQSCAGSAYATLTGNTTVPDLRGVFLRGKNYGRSTATGNPDGDLAVGTYTADRFAAHNHGVTDPGHSHAITDPTHNHVINDPGHDHGSTQSAHSHGITDGGHQHDIEVHVSPSNLGGRVNAANDTGTSAVYGNNNIKVATTGVSVNANTISITINPSLSNTFLSAAATNITVNSGTTGVSTTNTGTTETAPRNVTVNSFIRVN